MKDYKKILEGVVNIINTTEKSDIGFVNICTYIDENCPELKESEDEKIRKALIDYFDDANKADENPLQSYGIHTDNAIAWLEKQGEQKTIWHNEDEEPQRGSLILLIMQSGNPIVAKVIEPNHTFNHGERWAYIDDLLENQGSPVLSNSSNIGKGEKCPVGKVEPKFHEGEWVILTAGELSTTLQIVKVDTNKKLYWFNDSSYLPIVDEECLHLWTIQGAKDGDVLCSESGWTCIFKALDNHTNTFSSYCFMDNYKWFCNTGSECHTLDKAFIKAYNGEIYPATKEQCDTLLKAMADAGYTFDFEKKELKKIEQKPAEWSEEDEYMLNETIQHLKELIEIDKAKYCACDVQYYQRDIDWLKSFKPQNNITDEELVQAKKDAYNDALDKIEYHSGELTFDDGWSAAIDYIRKKSLRPQNHWKPTEEQVEAFEHFVRSIGESGNASPYENNTKLLYSLLNDLEKLKE